MAEIHHLDVHPFLDCGSSTIATPLLKRGRDEKAISAIPSRPRFNRVVAIVDGPKSKKGWTSRGWNLATDQDTKWVLAPKPLEYVVEME